MYINGNYISLSIIFYANWLNNVINLFYFFNNIQVAEDTKKKEKQGYEEHRLDPLFAFWKSKFDIVNWKIMANLFLVITNFSFLFYY